MDEAKEKNRGFQLFMKCLDENPDVLGILREMSAKSPAAVEKRKTLKIKQSMKSVGSPMRSIQEPIKTKSGFALNIRDRFSSRPVSAPGPWTYFTMKPPREVKGSKFTSRKEPNSESLPSPGSYFLQDKASSRYGFVPREPKNKTDVNASKLGPGSYDLLSESFKSHGTTFAKDSRELDLARGKSVPGPGQYHTITPDTSKSFSISKTQPPLIQPPQKLGPGSYEIVTSNHVETANFSNSLRFDMPYFEKIETYLIMAKSRNRSPSDNTIIRRNLDISEYRPASKSESMRKKSVQDEFKREVTVKTHKAILESVKNKRQEALDSKFRRYEIRKHIDQVNTIGHTWFTVFTIVGAAYVWRVKTDNKSALRKRSDGALRLLMIFSMAIGKIMLNLKSRRLAKSMKSLQLIIKPVSRWKAKMMRTKARIVTECVEYAITHNLIFKIMAAWRIQLLKVVRRLHMALAARRAVYDNLILKWNKTEADIAKNLNKTGKPVDKGVFNIPVEVKKFIMRFKIKEAVRRHRIRMAVYNLEIKAAQKELKAAQREAILDTVLTGKETPVDLKLSVKPQMSLNFDKEVIKEMILKAQALRIYWDRIVTCSNPAVLEHEFANILREPTYSQKNSPSRSSKNRTDNPDLEESKQKKTPKSRAKKH